MTVEFISTVQKQTLNMAASLNIELQKSLLQFEFQTVYTEMINVQGKL